MPRVVRRMRGTGCRPTRLPAAVTGAREGADGGRGLSDAELARRIGARRWEIVAYEQGDRRPEPARIRVLAEALKVAPEALSDGRRGERTLSDLRRARGWTAQSLSRELQVSERSYRRLECEGLEPACQRGLVGKVAVLLEIDGVEM
ncbi:helix-turn-helix transcriptional regulator [Streptomyces sp. NPDC002688]|uniref:helix-turn-helix domain-containing protein n=1 Tax=Streptomyces sp. NPDC002688 TaxID=3154423 RepID=UPI00332331C0